MPKVGNSLDASRPEQNATVHASAGTGKTWLLITRLTRMLLSDIEPGNIVALTFTRKAASEMLSRLHERIESLATNNQQQLDSVLIQSGIEPSPALRLKAQQQFEKLLHSEYPVRVSTFHSFCQDLLLRFPLEAEVPPAFDLLNSTTLIQQEAWELLYQEAELSSDARSQKALQDLFNYCEGLGSTTSLLNEFLNARIDWWAWTHDKQDPVQFACDNLLQELNLDNLDSTQPDVVLNAMFNKTFCQNLSNIAELISIHDTKTNLSHASLLIESVDSSRSTQQRFNNVYSALIVQKTGLPRKIAKALLNKLQPEQAARLPELYEEVAQQIILMQDLLLRLHSWHLSCAWYAAGHSLLAKFQEIKRQRRLLDFSDLEWKTYRLLNQGDNALWVQYKLDQRINHLLIDEFQDTSPSQWHMILPVLQEFAASDNSRHRSVFIVGDEKQSIYQFRRANPELLSIAAEWLHNKIGATAFHMDLSRRSSPAIIDIVNSVFEAPSTEQSTALMPDWQQHQTFHKDLWGAVSVLPLVCPEKDENNADTQTFRNPLNEPQMADNNSRHAIEARQIAAKIQELISQPLLINIDEQVRPLGYSDIMILIPRRTHAGDIELALTESKIPFVGAERGTLLQCLEIQDLCALLRLLIIPYDNLALAQVLRCPLYAATEEDLLLLAQTSTNNKHHCWYESLQQLQQQTSLAEDSPLLRAWQQISHWRQWAGVLPVHDLLDRIYHESDLINCYTKVYPDSLRPRLHANFSHFIDIALDLDSGRYPGLTRFLDHIQTLRSDPNDAPSTPVAAGADNRVKIITIHSAKGLEAPVVFLANATKAPSRSSGYTTIVDWPSNNNRPNELFIIKNNAANASIISQKLKRRNALYEQEKNNLMYVAMTRARQYLYVSGSILPSKEKDLSSKLGWYGMIYDAVALKTKHNNQDLDYSRGIEYTYGQADASDLRPKDIIDETDNSEQNNSGTARSKSGSLSSNTQESMQFDLDLANKTKPTSTKPGAPPPIFISPSKLDHKDHQRFNENTIDSSFKQSKDTGQNPDNPAQNVERNQERRGVTLHRILELGCAQLDLGRSPDWNKIMYSMSNDNRYIQDKKQQQLILNEVKAILKTKTLKQYFEPQHYLHILNEVPICYSVKSGTVNGIIDRLLITEHEAIIIDYKSHRIEAEQKHSSAESFRTQLESYKKGIQQIWPEKKIKCLILFTAIAESVEL